MSISKKFAAGAAAVAVAGGLAVVTTGTASAAPQRHCDYSRSWDTSIDLGIVHGGIASDDCAWVVPGQGIPGFRGEPNTIAIGNIPLPNGEYVVGFVDDPTGMYPMGNDHGIW